MIYRRLIIMADYVGFFFNSPSRVVDLQTFEIQHPNFSRWYRIVRNNKNGLWANLETGENVFFEYYPVKITAQSDVGDLDFSIQIDFGDLGEIIPKELDRVRAANAMGIKPKVLYREYRSDDLSSPMNGPLILEAKQFSFKNDGATFEAKAPSLNINRTGITYSVSGPFRTLRGFL